MGEARPRPRTEVEGPSSRVPGSLFELAPGGGEGASASVQRFRDARVFLLTRWHCLQWGTQLGTGLSIRAPATFLCVLWGWGWGWGTCTVQMARPSSAHLPSGRSPISTPGSAKEEETEVSPAPTKSSTVSFLGTYQRVDVQKEASELRPHWCPRMPSPGLSLPSPILLGRHFSPGTMQWPHQSHQPRGRVPLLLGSSQ